MMDFFFFVKTFLLTIFVVLLLQVQIGKKTVETHMHDWMENSIASGFLDHAAHGGAHWLKDAAHDLGEKMKANIGAKHKHGDAETKASHFHWGWGHATQAASSTADEDSGSDVD